MPTNNNETAEKGGLAKIDELMADIDLTKPFDNLNNGDRYEIGKYLRPYFVSSTKPSFQAPVLAKAASPRSSLANH